MNPSQGDDPFAPPKASLDVAPEEKGPRPRRVKTAALLVMVSAVFGLLMNIAISAGVVNLGPGFQGDPMQMASGLVTFAFVVFVAWKIYQGRNWARWLYAVGFVLGLIGLMGTLIAVATVRTPVMQLLVLTNVIHSIINAAAVYLMFTGDAPAWYRR